jgi:hypothetical protein
MVTRVTKLVVYDVRTGDGSGPYDKGAYYVEWDELVKQLREALDAGRSNPARQGRDDRGRVRGARRRTSRKARTPCYD